MMNNNYPEGQNKETVSVLLAFGSNLGEKINNITKTINLLNNSGYLQLIKSSSFYATEPMGFANQPWFINSVALFQTNLLPESLYELIKLIEKQIGRKQRDKWHEREIDIDILLYGQQIIKTDILTIPHKNMHERLFVLVPAAEITPNMIHPIYNLTISHLLEKCKDTLTLSKI